MDSKENLNMKKILIFSIIFLFPLGAFASDFTTSGFGDSNANGCWVDTETSYNSRPIYENNVSHWISFFPTNGNGWYINDTLTEAYAMYYDDSSFTNPWENDWIASSGSAPPGISYQDDGCGVLPPPPSPEYEPTLSTYFVQIILNYIKIIVGFVALLWIPYRVFFWKKKSYLSI